MTKNSCHKGRHKVPFQKMNLFKIFLQVDIFTERKNNPEKFRWCLALKIDFESQVLAFFDRYFRPFNKNDEKIHALFFSESWFQSEIFLPNSVDLMKNLPVVAAAAVAALFVDRWELYPRCCLFRELAAFPLTLRLMISNFEAKHQQHISHFHFNFEVHWKR